MWSVEGRLLQILKGSFWLQKIAWPRKAFFHEYSQTALCSSDDRGEHFWSIFPKKCCQAKWDLRASGRHPLPWSCYMSAAHFLPMLWDAASAPLLNTDSPFCPLCTSPEMTAPPPSFPLGAFCHLHFRKAKGRGKTWTGAGRLEQELLNQGRFVCSFSIAEIAMTWQCRYTDMYTFSLPFSPFPTPLSMKMVSRLLKTKILSQSLLSRSMQTPTHKDVGFYFIQTLHYILSVTLMFL